MKTMSFVFLAMVLPSALFVAASLLINGELMAVVCNGQKPQDPAPFCGPYHPGCLGYSSTTCPEPFEADCFSNGPYDRGYERNRLPLACGPGDLDDHCIWSEDPEVCYEIWPCAWNEMDGKCLPTGEEYCVQDTEIYKVLEPDCVPAG